jgi:hypothetical protein
MTKGLIERLTLLLSHLVMFLLSEIFSGYPKQAVVGTLYWRKNMLCKSLNFKIILVLKPRNQQSCIKYGLVSS